MWDDEDDGERLEYALGATAHLLAQMGDQQASLLLEDVERMDIESEDRGRHEPDPWGGQVEVPAYEKVFYLEVEPYLQPRFTEQVLGRILPILRDVAARVYLPRPNYLETRACLPPIDTKTWREALRQQYGGDDALNQARRERLSPDSPVKDGLTFSNAYELAVYESLLRLQAATPEDRTFAVAPLPGVRIRAGNVWTPDFLVVGNGRAMVIEVDGPHHAKERRRADDDVRDLQFRRCGLEVRRVPVEYTDPERSGELDPYIREVVKAGLRFGQA